MNGHYTQHSFSSKSKISPPKISFLEVYFWFCHWLEQEVDLYLMQFMVIYFMSSSKNYTNSSSRTWQIPVSIVCLCCSLSSKLLYNYKSSARVATVTLTLWIHNYYLSMVYSFGGKILFRISSVFVLVMLFGTFHF